MTRDCPACGHDGTSHNSGTCIVAGSSSADGWIEYPNGCGCTALIPDRTCLTCGARYYCGAPSHAEHDCYRCYDRKRTQRDVDSFYPLVTALREHGVANVPDLPWNTGGNIMCLAIPLGEGQYPYIMFSDDAEMLGFGLYLADEAWVMCDPEWVEEIGEDRYDKGWDTPGLAERVASWTASILPALREWIATAVTYTEGEPYTLYGSTVRDNAATWDADPILPATLAGYAQKSEVRVR
jgi:hypothetical protein